MLAKVYQVNFRIRIQFGFIFQEIGCKTSKKKKFVIEKSQIIRFFDQPLSSSKKYRKFDYYWRSKRTKGILDQEHLVYKLASRDHPEKALIVSIVLLVFQGNYNLKDEIFPPQQIQIEVGNELGKYHYKSKVFAVKYDGSKEQTFSLLPDLVCGEFIKITLLGKPNVERHEQDRYIAIRYVGVVGKKIDDIQATAITNLFINEEVHINQSESDLNQKLLQREIGISKQKQEDRYGVVDYYATMIVFKMMDHLQNDQEERYSFLKELKSQEFHFRQIKSEVERYIRCLGVDAWIFLKAFKLDLEYFEYEIEQALISYCSVSQAFNIFCKTCKIIKVRSNQKLDLLRMVKKKLN
ncbi:UNKNOWN [Stylonychia lemnae]|uniref:Uncharacterized protein n=1 Tax=Stylonychia lemnae TaxID=5949 RepID=A0A078AYL5_STYLE|nr:UNKNOWN [Stylonychia lemnae]|eukprot:CDW87226.1 UNKNOWN [Stylonychia lemnae]